jgi:hypothetical protein
MMRFPPFTTILSRRRLALIALAAGAAPAAAQTPPANTQLPQTIPGLENFTIAPTRPRPMPVPTPTPTPVPVVPIQPLPTPTPTPTPTPRTAPPRVVRTPSPAPTPSPTPRSAATPTPSTAPTAAPSPAATPTPVATITPAPVPAPAPITAPRHSLLWIALFIALLLLPALGIVLWFVRRSQWSSAAPAEAIDDDDDDWIAPDQVSPAVAAPAPVAPPRHLPGASARPRLEIAFTPRSAGLNGVNAAVDYDLLIRNAGDLPAEQVQLRVELITAGNAHDAELEARLGQPIEKPMIAPFTLAAGQQRPIRALAQLPKDAVNVVTVMNRPMFVPIVAIDLRYRWATGEGQTAESFVIGIAPKQGDRMRPFWLDVPPRMDDAVMARPHAVGARR